MLSGISHDLRTPLTRLKLQLAMMEKKVLKKMSSDIDEMEKMLNDYLQYAKSQAEESSSKIDLNVFIKEILKNYDEKDTIFQVNIILKLKAEKILLGDV